jgi:hypothetical protein
MTLDLEVSAHTATFRNVRTGAQVELLAITREGIEHGTSWDVKQMMLEGDSAQSIVDRLYDNSPVNERARVWSWLLLEYVGRDSQSDNWSPDVDKKGFSDVSLIAILNWANHYLPLQHTRLSWFRV